MSDYYSKYMKYKSKYLRLKKQLGGLTLPYSISFDIPNSLEFYELNKTYMSKFYEYFNGKYSPENMDNYITEVAPNGVMYIKLPTKYKIPEIQKMLSEHQTKSIDEELKEIKNKEYEAKLAREDAALDEEYNSRRRR